MAIWQYSIILVPREALKARYGAVPITVPEVDAQEFDWWAGRQPDSSWQREIDAILPRSESWSEMLFRWGHDEKDRASACFKDSSRDEVVSLEFRIDVRSISTEYLAKICALAKHLDCLFIAFQNYHVMEPVADVIFRAVKKSTAQRFVNDPVATLTGLKKQRSGVTRLPEK